MIFLCYCRTDYLVAMRLMQALQARGETIECDPPLAQGDAFWREKVWDLLQRCSKMIILWSPEAAASPWVDQEIRAFAGPQQFIIVGQPTLFPEDCYELPPEATPLSLLHLPASDHEKWQQDCSAEELRIQRQRQIEQETDRLQHFRQDWQNRTQPWFHHGNGELRLADGGMLKKVRSGGSVVENSSTFLLTSPVTNARYRRFVESTSYPPPPTWTRREFRLPHAPVTGITWFEAQAYAAWVGGELPHETDWEWAATAGKALHPYATQSGTLTSDEAVFNRTFVGGAPASVVCCPPNPFGFFGLCGNVWEWCADSWGGHRALRGGGYMDSARFCHVTARYRNAPIDRDCCVGFRVKIVVHP